MPSEQDGLVAMDTDSQVTRLSYVLSELLVERVGHHRPSEAFWEPDDDLIQH